MNPTKSQLEAYRLVQMQGLTQASAAAFMGISQPAISKHLSKVGCMLATHITAPKFVSYDEIRDCDINWKL
jgi:predicted DNA-binding protein (UPF0251 family)